MKDKQVESVGLRELSNSLSAFVKKASEGIRVLITDRGRVVAEIRKTQQWGSEDVHPILLGWEAEGKIRIGRAKKRAFPRGKTALSGHDIATLLDNSRGER